MTAAGEVRGLESAIASLTSKSIVVTTNFVTTHTGRASGGPVAPGVPYTVGEAGREMFVPSVPGIIIPHPETERMLSPVASPATTAALGGSGTVSLKATINHTSNLDGREIWKSVQTQMLQWQVRNSGRATGLTVPQAPGALR